MARCWLNSPARSLTSRPFLESFARVYEERPRIAAQLVLMFSQRAIDGLTPAAWEAVRDMHAFGFRFALDKIEHMGTDLAALAHSGFRFIRFDAQALLNGLASRDRFVAADEIIPAGNACGFVDRRDAASAMPRRRHACSSPASCSAKGRCSVRRARLASTAPSSASLGGGLTNIRGLGAG